MTNPYHDAEGRFSSANEMKEAIAILAQQGDIAGSIKLRQEYDAIELTKQAKKDAKKPSPKLTYDNTTTVQNLFSESEIYLDDPEDRSGMFKTFLENPNTPSTIRNQILTQSTEETRKGLLLSIEAKKYDGANEDYLKIVHTFPEDRAVLREAMTSKVLTLNDKQALAPTFIGGYAVMGLTNPRFYNRYGTESGLREETVKLNKNQDVRLHHNAMRALAKGKDTESHELLISKLHDSTHITAVQEMMKNKHVKPETMNKLFAKIADTNIQNWVPAVTAIADTQARYRPWAKRFNIQDKLEGRPTIKQPTPENIAKLTALGNARKVRQLAPSENDQFVTLRSKYDAYDANYNNLKNRIANYEVLDANNTESLADLTERAKYADIQRIASVMFNYNKEFTKTNPKG